MERVHAAGGRLIVAPNCDARVIHATLRLGMTMIPGFATATEAFAALEAGATGFGCGSELFRPHFTLEEIAARAQRIVRASRLSPLSG